MVKVVKELKQHIGGFTGRLMDLWDAIADLGYSSSSECENMIIVYDLDDKPVARIGTEYTANGGSDDIKVTSIFY